MRAAAALLAATLSGLSATAGDGPVSPSASSAAPVAQLITQLGHPDFRTREAAAKALDAVGPPALPALAAAVGSADAEVARRAAGLVAGITQRVDNDRALAPALVELAAENRPLAEVFASLERQTGYKFAVTDAAMLTKAVTVKTAGAEPFWVALDRVCAAAGLDVTAATYDSRTASAVRQAAVRGLEAVAGAAAGLDRPTEVVPVRAIPLQARQLSPTAPPAVGPRVGPADVTKELSALLEQRRLVADRIRSAETADERKRLEAERDAQNQELRRLAEQMAGGRAPLWARPGGELPVPGSGRPTPPAVPHADGTVGLKPQAAASNPLCVSGAVRVEAEPAPVSCRAAAPADVIPIVLTAVPEPKLKWGRVESVRVTKAVDSAGHAFVAAGPKPAAVEVAAATRAQNDGAVIVWDVAGGRLGSDGARAAGDVFRPRPTQAVLWLAAGDRPPRALKELEGVIRAVVQTEPEEVVAVGLDSPAVAFGRNTVALRTGKPEPAAGGEGGFTLNVTVGYRQDEVRVADGTAPDQTAVGPNGQLIVRQQMVGRNNEVVIRQQVIVPGAPVRRAGLRGPVGPESGLSLFGLRVTDAAGTPFELSAPTAVRRLEPTGGLTDEVKLVLRPTEAGQGKPARVSFHGARSKTIEVPFRLADVPVALGTGRAAPAAPPQ